MMRQRLLRAAIGQRLHRVRRVHVLVAHEPARLIGADRQDRQPQRAMGFGDASKMLAVAVAGIADDVEFADRRLQHKTRPQRLVAVEQPARRPVPRRHQRHRNAVAEFDAILPVERFGFDRRVRIAHGDVVAERRDHARRKLLPRASTASPDRDDRNGRATPARCRSSAAHRTRCRDRCAASARQRKTARRASTTPDRPGCSGPRSGSASSRGRRTTAAPCCLDARRRRVGMRASAPIPARLARLRPPPNCQRSTSPSDFGGDPSGSKKCIPSK